MQQLVVYEPLGRRPEQSRPSPSQPIQVPVLDGQTIPSPASSSSAASPPAAEAPRRLASVGSDSDLASSTPSTSPYAGGELPRVRVPVMRSGISRHHTAKSLPLLSRLRHERDRKYSFESAPYFQYSPQAAVSLITFSAAVAGDDSLATLPQSYLTSTGSSPPNQLGELTTSPAPQRRGSSFAAAIPDEYRVSERDVLKEHVRYFISEQKNMLGELTVTPSKVIFEPELDDPMTRELGLMRSHFQCDMHNVIDVHILDAAEVVASWRSKLTRVEGDFALPGSPPTNFSQLSDEGYERALDFSGVDAGTVSDTRPRFIQLAVMASSTADPKTVDTGRIVYFLINRVAAEVFNRKLHEWMLAARSAASDFPAAASTRRSSVSSSSVPQLQRRSSGNSLVGGPAKTAAPAGRNVRVSLDGSSIPIPHTKQQGAPSSSSSALSTSAPGTNWTKIYDDAEEAAKNKGHRRQPSATIGPTLKDVSVILQTPEIQVKLASILPARYRHCAWNLLYSTARHGVSLNTFYMKTRNRGPSVMLVEDSEGFVFGAFVSESWEVRKGFYGTGESLLFTLFPAFNVYSWSGLNDYFMFAREDQMAIGGGGGKFGLWLDSEFLQGASAPCDTFLNSTLASQEYFQCAVMECWGFDPYDS